MDQLFTKALPINYTGAALPIFFIDVWVKWKTSLNNNYFGPVHKLRIVYKGQPRNVKFSPSVKKDVLKKLFETTEPSSTIKNTFIVSDFSVLAYLGNEVKRQLKNF